jgi:hypothetical protein
MSSGFVWIGETVLLRRPKIFTRLDFRFLKFGFGVNAVGGKPDVVFLVGDGTDSSGFRSDRDF